MQHLQATNSTSCATARPGHLQVLYEDPWKLLVACMLLNKTSSTQVRGSAQVHGFALVNGSVYWSVAIHAGPCFHSGLRLSLSLLVCVFALVHAFILVCVFALVHAFILVSGAALVHASILVCESVLVDGVPARTHPAPSVSPTSLPFELLKSWTCHLGCSKDCSKERLGLAWHCQHQHNGVTVWAGTDRQTDSCAASAQGRGV